MLSGSMWSRITKWCHFIILERYRKVKAVMEGNVHWLVKFEKSWGLMLNCWNQVIPKILRIYPFAWIGNIENIPWCWGYYLPQWRYLIDPKKYRIKNKHKLGIYIWSFDSSKSFYLNFWIFPNLTKSKTMSSRIAKRGQKVILVLEWSGMWTKVIYKPNYA